MGRELPIAVPAELLRGQPACSLAKPSLDLAHVDRGIQRFAAVVQDVDPENPVLAGQRIDDDLRNRCTISVVEEGPPAERRAVVVDFGRAIEARRRQRYACEPGTLYQIFEIDALRANPDLVVDELDVVLRDIEVFRSKFDQPPFDLRSGSLRCLAVNVGSARSCRGRSVRHFARVRCHHFDAVNVDLQFFSNDLRHFGKQSLPHLGTAVVQVNCAVGIDMYQCACLVQVGRRK